MEVSITIESIASLFAMILVGVYGSKRKVITDKMNKELVNLLIQIALPFMILSSFIFTFDNAIKSNVIKTFYYSIGSYIVMIFISYLLLLPIKKHKKTILHFGNVFTNTGYVGFPILHSIYGAEGVAYGSVFNMFFVILLWTYGLTLFKDNFNIKELKTELKKVFLNPSIIAVALGIIIMLFGIQLPTALLSSINAIGNMTGPLSMIIIGAILSKIKIKKHLNDWTLYYGVTIKLMIMPLIIYFLSLFIGGPSKVLNTIIIMSAMPASTMTSILAEVFDKEKEYAAIVVSMTTLLSLITVIVLLKIIQ